MKKQLIRYGVGIDVSKAELVVCVKGLNREEEESVKGRRKFANTISGLEKLLQWLEKQRKDSSVPFRILMEVTGVYHENLIYTLHEAGYYVSLELAKRVKSYLKSLGQDSKTDKADAAGIASMALHRKLPQWQPISDQLMAVRQLVRHRARLQADKVRYHNQLHAYEHSRTQVPEVGASLRQHIELLKEEIEQIEANIEARLKDDPELYQRIMRIVDSTPGVGLITVATVVAETDGFSFITSAKQLTKYAGYDVLERESGTLKGQPRISKHGNARLRTAMYMPAISLIRSKKTPLYRLYLRLCERNGGIKKKALVAVQRKMLCLIYALWKSGEAYDPDFQNPNRRAQSKTEHTQKSSPEDPSELHRIEPSLTVLPNAST